MKEKRPQNGRPVQGMSRRRFLEATAAGTAGVALGTGPARAAQDEPALSTSDQPNIIFITTDEHRYDALGCAGNDAIQTPVLDRLASEGTRFSRTYCQGPLCQPSRASLITGRYVRDHGQSWNRMDMNPEWPTMMKQLQAAGYYTAKVGKTHFYGGSPSGTTDFRKNTDYVKSYGFDYVLEEFDKYIHVLENGITPYTEYLKERGLFETYRKEVPDLLGTPGPDRPPLYLGETSQLAQEHDLTCFIADQAIDWLRNYDGGKPFFKWISFVGPHPPLTDDPVWAKHYENAGVPVGNLKHPDLPENAWGRYLRSWIKGTKTENLTEELVRNSTRHYYGMTSLIDQRIGDILRTVEEMGWGDNTWIVFTADHGEMMGEHGLMFKNVFYKGSVLVPNIIRPPKAMQPRVIDTPTESIDIIATLMDVTGTEPPEGASGKSLVPFMEGKGKAREVAYSELAGHGNQGNYFVMAATERYRYVYDKENDLPCELFDLREDPGEMHNLVDDPAHKGIRDDMHKDYVLPFMNV